MRLLGTQPTTAEKIDLSKRRGKLRVRVADHQKKARRFLKLTEDEEDNEKFDFEEPEVLLDTDDLPSDVDIFYESTEVEKYSIAMPSGLSAEKREERLLQKAVASEIQLRLGQCNDALQGIRMAIGKKAFIYVSDVRKAKNQKGKTKSYDAIKGAHKVLQHQAQLYRSSRKALLDLGAGNELLQKYQVLLTSQLSTRDTFLDVTERGQKHRNLPWFWNLDVEGDSEDNGRMEECMWTTHGNKHYSDSQDLQFTELTGYVHDPVFNGLRRKSSLSCLRWTGQYDIFNIVQRHGVSGGMDTGQTDTPAMLPEARLCGAGLRKGHADALIRLWRGILWSMPHRLFPCWMRLYT